MRLNGVQKVGGSNPPAPTKDYGGLRVADESVDTGWCVYGVSAPKQGAKLGYWKNLSIELEGGDPTACVGVAVCASCFYDPALKAIVQDAATLG